MSERTWSNADIRAALTVEPARMVAERIRDDGERRIAELEAQLARHGEWVPVEGDAVIPCACGGENCTQQVLQSAFGEISTSSQYGAPKSVQLPPDVRLCRRTSSEEASDG